MEGFTLVDGVVLLVMAISCLLAYSRGFVREIMAIFGWIIAAIVAYFLSPAVQPLITEVPYLGELIGPSCELALMAAFVAVFAVTLVIVSLFAPLLSGAVQNSSMGPVDKGLGFVFGFARGALLVAVAFVLYGQFIGEGPGMAAVEGSKSKVVIAGAQGALQEQLPNQAPEWIIARYDELTTSCRLN
ncbi:MAG: CvpA family protein [Paracoccaceae bacterium]